MSSNLSLRSFELNSYTQTKPLLCEQLDLSVKWNANYIEVYASWRQIQESSSVVDQHILVTIFLLVLA